MDLTEFAAAVGDHGPVTIAGSGTRGGAVPDLRAVQAPAGVVELFAEEMTIRCGAGTPVEEVAQALEAHGQFVALPGGGTVGGALAVGHSDCLRLGHGPLRDTVLQVRYVSAAGVVVMAGGPTVKNVSGFDLARLLVGSKGTLGFLGEVILRTRPAPTVRRWFRAEGADPFGLLGLVYRPAAVLWDGTTTWVALEGHPADVGAQAARIHGGVEVSGPPSLPSGSRRSYRPSELAALAEQEPAGSFVAEVGVGVVHHRDPDSRPRVVPAALLRLHQRLRLEFDPEGRLNPGVSVLAAATVG
jgi:FAD/FMN-containing dehydrogenase